MARGNRGGVIIGAAGLGLAAFLWYRDRGAEGVPDVSPTANVAAASAASGGGTQGGATTLQGNRQGAPAASAPSHTKGAPSAPPFTLPTPDPGARFPGIFGDIFNVTPGAKHGITTSIIRPPAPIWNAGASATGKSSDADAEHAARGAVTATYKIQSGDTLGGIAARFNSTVSELVELNRNTGAIGKHADGRANPDLIYVGHTLRVPV